MKIKRKAIINELYFPVQGYSYNVQIWISVDGGETYGYCGLGKYFRTAQEAQQYAASVPEEE